MIICRKIAVGGGGGGRVFHIPLWNGGQYKGLGVDPECQRHNSMKCQLYCPEEDVIVSALEIVSFASIVLEQLGEKPMSVKVCVGPRQCSNPITELLSY